MNKTLLQTPLFSVECRSLTLRDGRSVDRWVIQHPGAVVVLQAAAELPVRLAALVGGRPPIGRIPRALALPVGWMAETAARLTGSHREPLATVDGVRMAKRLMFFTSAKAERELGYRARPVEAGLSDAIGWFRENGYC